MTGVLIADDDDPFRHSLADLLVGAGYEPRQAASGVDARRQLDADPDIAAVLCDVEMAGGSGLGILAHVAADFPDVAVVITHGVDDPETARLAFEIGADGYLIKPFTNNEILISLANGLARRRLDIERRGHLRELELTIARLRTLTAALGRIENAASGETNEEETIDRLAKAISLRDEGTGRHVERMSRYSAMLAEAVGFGTWTPDQVRLITALHDVGNVGVPDTILLRHGPLSPDELTTMRRHAQIGYQLLAGTTSKLVMAAAVVALTHHECWDGGGYPSGLRGEDIPELGRIAAVANVFDSLTSERVYRPGLGPDEAVAVMTDLRSRQFEPRLLDAFLGSMDEIGAIREAFADTAEDRVRIRLLVVDDHPIFVERLLRLLDGHGTLKVVGTAASVTEAEQAAVAYDPDVILMDLDLPGADGIAATGRISAVRPAAKVVMLTGRTEHDAFVRAIGAGAAGFVTKSESVDNLVGAVRAAHDGDALPPVSNLQQLLLELSSTGRGLGSDLRARELEVLRLVAGGLSNKAIAERLYISLNTVRNHVQRILYKLDAHSRLEAVATAVREGLIERDNQASTGS